MKECKTCIHNWCGTSNHDGCQRGIPSLLTGKCVNYKQYSIMKDLVKDWKFWLVFGIVAAIIIAAVVCHLVQPKVTYAWLEVVSAFTFVLGGVAGGFIGSYLASKK